MDQFGKIYNENYKLIFNVVHKMVPDSDDASDLVQEVFIELYQYMKESTVKYPRSWLYKVTINRCIDFARKRQKYEKIECCSNLKDEDQYEIDGNESIIRLALTRLKKEESLLAVLYSEGLSYKEIAEITGIHFSSVGKTLSRTLKKLKNELQKFKYDLY